jgi:tRNA/tmRNA/rRNA uracil-C5-methylase (TrmA/RlmC/RlmD family)
VIEGPRFGFRYRARLAIRGRVENPKIGIFESGTHRVVHIPQCRVHHPLVNQVARVVREAAIESRVPPYSDAAHAGRLRYLQVVVERGSGAAQLVIVTADTEPAGLSHFFSRIIAQLGSRLHSLWWNGQPHRSNAVLGTLWQRVTGAETVVEKLSDTEVHYPPGAFGQSNLELAETLGACVAGWVPDSARVLELYAGVGALGLPLVARVQRLDLNELGEQSLVGLRLGIDALPQELRARVGLHPGNAGDVAHLVASADTVIVDPPRKGLEPQLIGALLAEPPERLIYVSCDVSSLQRDAASLLQGGRLRLSELQLVAMFPFTEHVETLARFEKT